MSSERVAEPGSSTDLVHYRAEAHARTAPIVLDLGYWAALDAAYRACAAHSGGTLQLNSVYNGLWEAHGTTHRYQIVMILGRLDS